MTGEAGCQRFPVPVPAMEICGCLPYRCPSGSTISPQRLKGPLHLPYPVSHGHKRCVRIMRPFRGMCHTTPVRGEPVHPNSDIDVFSIDPTDGMFSMVTAPSPSASASSTPPSTLQALPGYYPALSIQHQLRPVGSWSNNTCSSTPSTVTSHSSSPASSERCWLNASIGERQFTQAPTYGYSSSQLADQMHGLNMGMNSGQQVHEVSHSSVFSMWY